ncbi:MAG: hypothetical protein N2444_10895, partial [Methylocystis sp.]|nr:hypothetical protein [Methylocystis sp.]
VAESRGYEWMKVAQRNLYPMPTTLLAVTRLEDIAEHRLKIFQPCLARADSAFHPYSTPVFETRPILTYPSRNPRPRLTLLAPTVNPNQTFGGIATAMRVFDELSSALGDEFDRRIVITDADIEPEAYERLPTFTPKPFVASRDDDRRVIIDACEREGGRLNLRAGDIFIATAWWTAQFAVDIERDRARYFGGALPFVYLVQDDEPYFYGWGSKFALAQATYDAKQAIAVVNSEELYSVMTEKHKFRDAAYIPYALNARIDSLLAPKPREAIILVYGRTYVARNAFELICEALFRWQQRDPIRASRWRVVFLGEDFPNERLYPVQNAMVGGKATLDAYADYLNRALVGVSLMISPHPSYPPCLLYTSPSP